MSFLPYIVLFILAIGYSVFTTFINKRKRIVTPVNYDIKIKVDLSNCEIKSNQYYETIEDDKTPSSIEIIDSLYGKSNSQSILTTVSVILFKYTYNNTEEKTYKSDPIYMSEDMITYKFEQVKNTTLYIDSKDPNNYYLDFGFLSINS